MRGAVRKTGQRPSGLLVLSTIPIISVAAQTLGLVPCLRKVQLLDQLSRRLATNFISLSHPEDQLSLGPDRRKQEFAFNDVATPC
jgi:hypothetical protein